MSDFDPSVFPDFSWGTFNLNDDGSLYADVFSTEDFTLHFPPDFDFTPVLGGILEYLDDLIPIPDDFDYSDPHVRGPYTNDELKKFFDESGLKDVVDEYYDEFTNEFWVYINTD